MIEITWQDPSTETYAHAVLGTQTTTEPDECKILCVLWNPSSDRLMVDVSELAQVAITLQPTKANFSELGRKVL